MQRIRIQHFKTLVTFVAVLLAFAESAIGQQFSLDDLKLPDGLEKFAVAQVASPGLKVDSHVSMSGDSAVGLLTINIRMNRSWKIYSLTQAIGPPATKIHLVPSKDYRLLGSFASDRPPKVEYNVDFKADIETFEGHVSWSVPIEVLGPQSTLVVQGHLEGLACAGQCVQFGDAETKFEARVTSAMPNLLKGKQIDGTHANVRTWLSTSQAAPGETIQLFVAFHPDPNWHVYAYSELPQSDFQKPTLIQATLPSGWKQGTVRSTAAVLSKNGPIPGDPPVREYAEPATLAVPIEVPEDAQLGHYPLAGNIAFQTCATQCDRPTAFTWHSKLEITNNAATPPVPHSVEIGATEKYDNVVSLIRQKEVPSATPRSQPVDSSGAEENATIEHDNSSTAGSTTPSFDVSNIEFSRETAANTSLARALGAAFLGGFILNFMPCVLPVIGLKIMSFVEQAGSDRGKVFRLNLWYVLGMLAIFWLLAGLAAAPALGISNNGLGWGEQFNYQGFAISLVCVVFVMALSFLGVWEIPIPGFATGNKATELATQEGLSGAFFKGGITTLLATPCNAPGLITAYAFAVNSGSATVPFLIFTVMGLGMGFPYLLIGAFPSLIHTLPKPGAWMDTFKQLMGFVLLATVVFLMQNVTFTNLLPTIGLLFGLWFACWWIGSVPMTASTDKRYRAWGVAAVIGMLAFVVCFGPSGLVRHAEHKLALATDRAVGERLESIDVDKPSGRLASHSSEALPWEPFSQKALNKMLQDGETVMVDFTADWCLVCRTLESKVLNTDAVRQAVQSNGVRTIVADWGTKDPAIGSLLQQLQGSRQIPFLAIFPAEQPENVIRFSGPYKQSTIIDALQQASLSHASKRDSERVASRDSPRPSQPTKTLHTSRQQLP